MSESKIKTGVTEYFHGLLKANDTNGLGLLNLLLNSIKSFGLNIDDIWIKVMIMALL